MTITSTMKHPSNSLVSNIRGQPLVIWKLIHAAIFGFDSDLQVKLFGGNDNVAYEHDMLVKWVSAGVGLQKRYWMPLSAHLLAYCYCDKDYSHERYVLSFSENVLIDWASLLGHQRE